MTTGELITSFGYWVRRRRKALDLTQAALAQLVGCALVTLKKIEWDERKPSAQMAERLADHLAIPAVQREHFLHMARGEFVTATLPSSAGLEVRLFKHNLPSPTTPFIGRARELADITRRLTDPTCRLLTLVGPGGIGKTRLAIQAAHHLVDTQPTELFFGHGIIFVSLTPVSSLSGLVAAIAGAANFTFYGDISARHQLLDYLREKEMLLVLDNFEQLLSLADRERQEAEEDQPETFIADILSSAPGVKILVTSREALNLQEAWFHPIEGLAFPGKNGAEDKATESYDAIRLFVQSARRARVGFSVATEPHSVIRICQLVAGVPLALELAATWLKMLTCEQIAGEIERNLDFLTVGLSNVPPRHRSMRAVFEQSWRLLAEAERAVLQRLSVFRGGFQQQAAEPVAGASLLTLASLVEKSLLQVTASGRYQLHELLRQFAGEKLAQCGQEASATRQRHSEYYLGLLKTCEPRLSGQEQPQALDELSLEIDNIRAGWGWAVEQGQLKAIDEVLATLYNFYEMRRRDQEGEEIFAWTIAQLRQAEALHEQPNFEAVLNRLAIRRGGFYYFLGDHEAANKHLLASLNSLDQPGELAFALTMLGRVANEQSKMATAEEWYRQSLALSREIGDLYGAAITLQGLAWEKTSFGDYAAAVELARESLALSRKLGRPDFVARALEALAWPTSCLGAYQEAEACWQESLLICQKIGNQWGVAYSEFNLGWVAFFGGIHLSEAFEHYHKALAMFREHGYRLGISQCCGDLALVTGESGDYELAMQYGREGLAKAREIRFNNVIIYNLCGLGAAACGLGDLQTGRNYLTEALQLGWETRILGQLMNALFYFAALLVKESNLAASTEPSDLQKKTRALELLAIVLGHPATWQPIKDRAARLQAEIEAGLARDNTTTATAPGQSRPLEEVVTEMLQLSYTPKMQ